MAPHALTRQYNGASRAPCSSESLLMSFFAPDKLWKWSYHISFCPVSPPCLEPCTVYWSLTCFQPPNGGPVRIISLILLQARTDAKDGVYQGHNIRYHWLLSHLVPHRAEFEGCVICPLSCSRHIDAAERNARLPLIFPT